ncbi:hypothetical protein jhhlp_005945 [Lomentospora prolificans]|uniref:Exonuclease V n=1 Tax=Lomentospora prolificans TaxID=41688 RepID=A0A2N3N4I6_9PEZI|nr:hypothetical protein jhhlp_005945 [Lomentospora prolificans]
MTTFAPPSFDDYYDLTSEEEALLIDLASKIVPTPPAAPAVSATTSVSGHVSSADLVTASGHVHQHYESVSVSSVATTNSTGAGRPPGAFPLSQPTSQPQQDTVVYPDLSRALAELPAEKTEAPPAVSEKNDDESDIEEVSADDFFKDERSPLVRFRTFPKKPFSVTDLTSGGAWCELQYYYTLTRLPWGRKTKTAIMREGSKVHKKLEDQVHTTVRVDVDTKEDLFGLKLWNFIQGLRTLRDTGLTRELEVWGMVDGQLCTGIVDSLSYSCPNSDFEDEIISSSQDSQDAKSDSKMRATPADNSSQLVYLCDVKTRGKPYPPKGAAMLRPVKIQLFLYHRFLAEMIKGNLDFSRVFRRLDIDPDEPFTDEFIAQVGSLHDEVFYDADPESSQESNGNGHASSDFVKYRTLRELLPLLRAELKLTFPNGVNSLGLLLSVDYRFRGDGSIIGSYTFPMDDQALDLHIASDMQWWKGERAPSGVDIEETFKCRLCEFSEECSWRAKMNRERLAKAKEKIRNGGV